MENLEGLKLKSWKVADHVGRGVWNCECEICGAIAQFRAYHIKDGRVRDCDHGNKQAHNFRIDLNGKIFGELVVKEFNSNTGQWICECSCGRTIEFTTYELNKRGVKSCGHSSNQFIDRTGQIFGELKALEYLGNYIWKCECSCGKLVNVKTGDLTSGNTKSCGHKKGRNEIDLTGKMIGEWKVIKYIGKSYWECECSCGEIRNVHSYTLRNNKSINCNSGLHKYTDIRGKKFGELIAKEYLGNGVWKCECSCGNIKNILGCNLRNNSTHSCGCKTEETMCKTLLQIYGDYCPSKSDSARTIMQQQIINDKKLFEACIVNYSCAYGRKPSLNDLGEILGVHRVTISSYLEKYELKNLVQIGYNISSYEREIREIVPKGIYNSKNILNTGLELDIYIPEYKIAIEFNGTYWHSSIFKDRMYHKNKTEACNKLGIRLIHIFEYEWIDEDKQQKIKSYLKGIFRDRKKIYGRDTDIEEISVQEASNFCEKYHLQGSIQSSIRIGLKHNNQLIATMMFGTPRFNQEYQYELLRLCYSDGIEVIGGTKKMFKYFIDKYKVNSIISYCNISKFTGTIYEELEFKLDHESSPNYVWVEPVSNDVLQRYKTQKSILLRDGIGEKDQTEDEIMESIGYLKIYDAGNKVFCWNR